MALFLVFHLRPLSLCHVATTLIKIFQSHFLFFLIHFSFLIRSQQQRKKKDASRHLTKCKYKFSRVRSYVSIKVFWYNFVYSALWQTEIEKIFLIIWGRYKTYFSINVEPRNPCARNMILCYVKNILNGNNCMLVNKKEVSSIVKMQ